MRALKIQSSTGFLAYSQALEEQKATARLLSEQKNEAYRLHFLEHAPVLTLGRATLAEHLPFSRDFYEQKGFEWVEVARGGSVTYHGPGQLVIYLHIHVRELGISLTKIFRDMEQWVIDFLALRGIKATTKKDKTGVWVGNEKICAMGLGVSHFITLHGIGLNLNPDMSVFDLFVPCGLKEAVTSMQKLGQPFDRSSVEQDLLKVLPPWLANLERD